MDKTSRLRTLPSDAPWFTVPVLWCLLFASIAGIVGGLALKGGRSVVSVPVSHHPQILPGILLGLLSLWGLYFRRFAFGTTWIAITLIAATTAATGLTFGFAKMVTAHGQGKDSIGHGIVAVFGSVIVFTAVFTAIVVGSSVAWIARIRRKRRMKGHSGL